MLLYTAGIRWIKEEEGVLGVTLGDDLQGITAGNLHILQTLVNLIGELVSVTVHDNAGMTATGAVVPFPSTFWTAAKAHVALEPYGPGHLNPATGLRRIAPELVGTQELAFGVKCHLNLLLELLELLLILTDIIESDDPVINVIDNLTVALPLGKEYCPASEIRLDIDTVGRHHPKDGACKLLLASVICDRCTHLQLNFFLYNPDGWSRHNSQ